MGPGKLWQAGALADVGHPGETEIDAIGKNGREQLGLVLDHPATALTESRPGIDLDQQVGDANARQ
jgi:hypothetical protein